jgi:DNA-binding NtrC family response regulator
LLAKHLAAECAKRLGKRVTGIEQRAIDALLDYSWPGNVRELQNVIERAVILANGADITAGTIRLDRPSPPNDSAATRESGPPSTDSTPPVTRTMAEAERLAIVNALRSAEGRVSGPRGAAAVLGLKPTTLHAKMKKLGVRRGDALKQADSSYFEDSSHLE